MFNLLKGPPMKLFNPVKLFIEHDCISNHASDLCVLGSRAFIVTGRSSASNGSLADVCSVLEAGGIPYAIFNAVEENPSVETCIQAAKESLAFQADFVIGIGGGSPLDAAKAVCVLASDAALDESCMYEKLPGITPLPLAAVPTTCGTGSEVTPNGVLTYHRFHTKSSTPYTVFPAIALVDGKYLAGAPESLLINTSVDALAHLIESYLSSKADSLNRMYSSYGLQLWGILKDTLFAREASEEEELHITAAMAQQLMLTSTIGGLAISQAGTSLPHAMSYGLTYEKGIPHGKACGIFLAAYMEQYARRNPSDTEDVCFFLGFDSIEEFGQWITDLLGTVSITKAEAAAFAEGLAQNTGKLATFPFALEYADIQEMYTKSLKITE